MKRVLMSFVLLAGLVLGSTARAQTLGFAWNLITQPGGYTQSFAYGAGYISKDEPILLNWTIPRMHSVSISITHLSSSPSQEIDSFSAILANAFTGQIKTFQYSEFGPLQALTLSDVWNPGGYYLLFLDGIAPTAGSFTVSAIASPVPEPETAVLFAAGLLLLGARLRSGARKIAPVGRCAQLA